MNTDTNLSQKSKSNGPDDSRIFLILLLGACCGFGTHWLIARGKPTESSTATKLLAEQVRKYKDLEADNAVCTNAHQQAVAEVERLQKELAKAIEAAEKAEAKNAPDVPEAESFFAVEINGWRYYKDATRKLPRYRLLRKEIDQRIENCKHAVADSKEGCEPPPPYATDGKLPLVLSLCPFDEGGDMVKLQLCIDHWYLGPSMKSNR